MQSGQEYEAVAQSLPLIHSMPQNGWGRQTPDKQGEKKTLGVVNRWIDTTPTDQSTVHRMWIRSILIASHSESKSNSGRISKNIRNWDFRFGALVRLWEIGCGLRIRGETFTPTHNHWKRVVNNVKSGWNRHTFLLIQCYAVCRISSLLTGVFNDFACCKKIVCIAFNCDL